MKQILLAVLIAALVTACNLKEGLKETGDAVSAGVDNVSEGVKQAPKDTGEASNKTAEGVK